MTAQITFYILHLHVSSFPTELHRLCEVIFEVFTSDQVDKSPYLSPETVWLSTIFSDPKNTVMNLFNRYYQNQLISLLVYPFTYPLPLYKKK